jgi:hypothetical protein
MHRHADRMTAAASTARRPLEIEHAGEKSRKRFICAYAKLEQDATEKSEICVLDLKEIKHANFRFERTARESPVA